MASACASSNKAKIARRVIEVLDYFDDEHREATVMDIVRRYDRPQSSTSELLSSLVELGLLHKDPYTRSYSLSPRAALLATAGQSEIIRDGRLPRLVDRLLSQTGLSVAVISMVGLNAQIASWRPGPRAAREARDDLHAGMQAPLNETSAGFLLLGTLDQRRREGLLRRLNAEAREDRKFSFADAAARVEECRQLRHVSGTFGFAGGADLVAMLVPGQPADHPMAVGFVHAPGDKVNPENLLRCLEEAMAQCLGQDSSDRVGRLEPFPNAA